MKEPALKYWGLSVPLLKRYHKHWEQGRATTAVLIYVRQHCIFRPQALTWADLKRMWIQLGLRVVAPEDVARVRELNIQLKAQASRKFRMPEAVIKAAALTYILENDIDLRSFAIEAFGAGPCEESPRVFAELPYCQSRRCRQCHKATMGKWFCDARCAKLHRYRRTTKRRKCLGCGVIFETRYPQKVYHETSCAIKLRNKLARERTARDERIELDAAKRAAT